MSQYKEITKQEAKELYDREPVFVTTNKRTVWELPTGYASHAPSEVLFYRSLPECEGEVRFFKHILDNRQMNHQRCLNKKHRWGMNKRILLGLYKKHIKGFETDDEVSMAEVEYRLTDANFHSLAGHLSAGRYGEALKEIESIFAK